MTAFVIGAAVLAAAAVWIVLAGLRPRAAASRGADAARVNRDALKAQLQQLDQDLAAGTLDADAHARLRTELARRLLEAPAEEALHDARVGTRTRWALLLAVPLLAAALYAAVGNPQALKPGAAAAQRELTQQDVEAMVAKLAERLDKQPPGRVEDLEAWTMLGRSYAVMQRFAEASRAYGRALQLAPDDPQLLADQADVMAMLQGQSLEGEPLKLIEHALRLDPSQPKALALAGSAAFDRKDYAAAAAYWERALAPAPADSEFAQGLARGIAEARKLAGTAAPATPGRGSADAKAAAAPDGAGEARAAAIRGRVSVARALAARIAPGDTVFVFARAASGPRAPLAILKRPASALPFDFTLDDTQSMAPQLRLSAFPQVIVGVRVSKSGDALPASGDLEGEAGPLPHRRDGVDLTIDRVRP